MSQTTIVIGAGPAGLAVAACLQMAGEAVTLLERDGDLGESWRRHYDCLSLHTAKSRSGLPGLGFGASVGRYPSRDEVVTYLCDYARHYGLAPRFGCGVKSVWKEDGVWRVRHDQGEERAAHVVLATGLNQSPNLPHWPGAFAGEMLHSSAYKRPEPFAGKRVLVVGFGNSAGDIALDLARVGVEVSLSVRGPVTILPKELFGVPITSFSLLPRLLGPALADRLTAPLRHWAIGQAGDYGLAAHDKGPARMIYEDGRIPHINVGALDAIRAGQIAVRPGVERLDGEEVLFVDGTTGGFDVVIAATGYQVDLRPLLGADCAALDARGVPMVSGGKTGVEGLYFCSFYVSPFGQLNAMGHEARAIAKQITAGAA